MYCITDRSFSSKYVAIVSVQHSNRLPTLIRRLPMLIYPYIHIYTVFVLELYSNCIIVIRYIAFHLVKYARMHGTAAKKTSLY